MAQVVVYGPGGARTTANNEKRPGEDKSELERLLDGKDEKKNRRNLV